MVKAEWGEKRTCTNCGARFYDLNRRPVICPACGAENDLTPAGRGRRSRSRAAVAETPVKVAPDIAGDDLVDADETLGDDEEQGSDVLEDAGDLGEDDDDMSEVMENVEGDERGEDR